MEGEINHLQSGHTDVLSISPGAKTADRRCKRSLIVWVANFSLKKTVYAALRAGYRLLDGAGDYGEHGLLSVVRPLL
jgi:diketogulonate reductase-like aldo/keto reductase